MLVLYTQWDETPTRLSLQSFMPQGRDIPDITGKRTAKQNDKVVQSELSLGFLVVSDGQPMYIAGELPCLLQAVEACTAECYGAALDRQCQLAFFAALRPLFKVVVRACTTDRDAANIRLQNFWRATDQTCGHLAFPCEVHNLSTAAGRSLRVLDRDVSGCIALAVAMQQAGVVALCRRAFEQALESCDFLDRIPGGHVQATDSEVVKQTQVVGHLVARLLGFVRPPEAHSEHLREWASLCQGAALREC